MSARRPILSAEGSLATFEVDETGPDPRPLVETLYPEVVINRIMPSPTGYAWFEIRVPGHPLDSGVGLAAQAVKALQEAYAAHERLDFRVLTGKHLLGLTDSSPKTP